jgi:PAS domain S-box-containing protein
MLVFLLAVSAVLQLIAAIMALRLIPLSGNNKSWIFISLALFLMSLRRLIPLSLLLTHSTRADQVFLTESIGMVLSLFMFIGVIGIRHYFLKHNTAIDELSESEQKFSEAFQHVPAGIVVSSLETGEIIDVNDTFLAKMEYTREEVIGRTSIELGLFGELNGRERLLTEVNKNQEVQSMGFSFVTKSGNTLYGLLSVSTFRLKGKKRLLTAVVDITDRHKVEVERLRMLNIIENSLNEIYIFNSNDLKYEYANQGALLNLGYTIDEIKQLTPADIQPFYDQKSFYKLIYPLVSGEKDILNFETIFKRKNNTHYFVEVHLQFHQHDNEKLFFAIINDITLRKKNEEELILAKEKAEEADKLKTAFLHNISHEIRTPMNAIIGFSGLMRDPALPPKKRDSFADILAQSTGQLLSIITDIINIATIESGQEKINQVRFNINQKLNLLLQQFIEKPNENKIQLRYHAGLSFEKAYLLSDQVKLTQVLTNLINNAFKFTSFGSIEFGYVIKDQMIEFFVKDTGEGIPEKMYTEIFKRFRQLDIGETRRYGGSGLGLSISKAYVELLGGQIWVESVVGKGSTFYFNIPYIPANEIFEAEPLLTDTIIDTSQQTIKVLVAEDEDSNYTLLYELLSQSNMLIIRATDGFQAVEVCKNDPTIKLVLMDIKMPGMDGMQATKIIKKLRPGLPVIAQTAYASEKEQQTVLESGCDDFISKPLNAPLLLKKIKSIMAEV